MPVNFDENYDPEAEAEAGDAEGSSSSSSSSSSPLQAQLDAATEQNVRLTRIVSDPDVASLVEAKESKKGIKIIIGDESAGEVPPEELPDAAELDDMPNSEFATVMLRHMGKVVSDNLESSGIVAKLTSVEESLSSTRKKDLEAQADSLVTKYPDLPKYKDDIVKLVETGLSLEESYMVARVRKGDGLPQATSTEKPTSVTVRKAPKEQPARMGPRGFSADVAEVLNRMNIPDL